MVIQEIPRWKKIVFAIGGIMFLVSGIGGFIVLSDTILLLVDVAPKAGVDWVSLLIMGVSDLLLLVWIALFVWMMYGLLKMRAT